MHKRNNKKNTVQTIQNKINTSTHITKTLTQLSKHPHIHTPTHYKTHTYTHPHIHTPTHTHTHTLQIKLYYHSTRYAQMKLSQYNQVPSV